MKISIITPNFNQSNLLKSTIRSVLDQEYDELEYIIIDGNSRDGSQDIIKSCEDRISYWCSEPDHGQYDAINKGFHRSTGEVMGWINSSDLYMPWTLKTVGNVFHSFPEIQWISSLQKVGIMEDGQFELIHRVSGFSASRFARGLHGGPKNSEFIQQESCFWRRSLWEKNGGKIDTSYQYAADFKLWADFFQYSRCTGVDAPLAAFRFHNHQRSSQGNYQKEVEQILKDLTQADRCRLMVSGYQNLMRQRSSAQVDSRWRLDANKDHMHLDILKNWNDLFCKFLWKITSFTYLPIALIKYVFRNKNKKL